MTTTRPVKIGVGMRDKRARILRSLHAHIAYLEMAEKMAPWTSPPRQERPARPPDPAPYRADMRGRYFSPREKPELAHPLRDGLDAITAAQAQAWVAGDPFVRSGLQPATQKAMAFLATFART